MSSLSSKSSGYLKRGREVGRDKIRLVLQLCEFLVKVFGVAITFLGVCAWIAGKAFFSGYWTAVGNGGPLSSSTIQEVAFFGFAAAIRIWFYAIFVIACFGALAWFFGIGLNRKNKKPSDKLIRVRTWFSERFSYDQDNKYISIFIIWVAAVLYSFVVFPLAGWVNSASDAGRERFDEIACHRLKGNDFPTGISMSEGGQLQGWVLDRSEKFMMLVDRSFVYTISLGEKVRVVEKTALKLTCKKP